jgi:hypothetical protein
LGKDDSLVENTKEIFLRANYTGHTQICPEDAS